MSDLKRFKLQKHEIFWTKCIIFAVFLTIVLIGLWRVWSYNLFYAQQLTPSRRPQGSFIYVLFWRERVFEAMVMSLFFFPFRPKGEKGWTHRALGISVRRFLLLVPTMVSVFVFFNGSVRGIIEPPALLGYKVFVILGSFIIAILMRGVVALLFRAKIFLQFAFPAKISPRDILPVIAAMAGSGAASTILRDLAETIPNFIYR